MRGKVACCKTMIEYKPGVVKQETHLDRPATSPLLSRAERAHYRLSWEKRLARNALVLTAGRVRIKLFVVPKGFATFLGLATT